MQHILRGKDHGFARAGHIGICQDAFFKKGILFHQ